MRPDLTARALDRGADGYFDLDAPLPDVLAALESATTGWTTEDGGMNPTAGSSEESRTHLTTAGAGLKEGEHQVLALIAQGLSNEEIANELDIGVNTVKTHIRSTYKKVGANSRASAVGWAIDHGLPSH